VSCGYVTELGRKLRCDLWKIFSSNLNEICRMARFKVKLKVIWRWKLEILQFSRRRSRPSVPHCANLFICSVSIHTIVARTGLLCTDVLLRNYSLTYSFPCWMQELGSLEEKMEYQLEERTRDMQDMLESCQTKVCLLVKMLDLWLSHCRFSSSFFLCNRFGHIVHIWRLWNYEDVIL